MALEYSGVLLAAYYLSVFEVEMLYRPLNGSIDTPPEVDYTA